MIYRNQFNPPPRRGIPPTGPVPTQPGLPPFEEILEGERQALISSLRELWTQLAIWSRSLIVSTAAGLGDIQEVTDRLMDIPEAFSRVLGRYFEPQDADRFRELLEEHISTVSALITAEKNNDVETINQETRNLYANADRIAGHLVGINSYWNLDEWKNFLYDYIEMMLADLVARLTGNYAREINIFDDWLNQAVRIADYTAQGMFEKFGP